MSADAPRGASLALTGPDRAWAVQDLADTRKLLLKCLGELRRQRAAGVATVASVQKLGWIVDACRKHIAIYEQRLAG